MTNSLVIFTKAALMLAEADTIQKAKELKDLALTAQDWAKRKNMGEDAIQHCRSYALEAERKMGEMLLETKRAKPPGSNQHKKQDRLHVVTNAPTLAEIGVSKRESSEAQKLAKAAKDDPEILGKLREGKVTLKQVLREQRKKQQAERIKELQDAPKVVAFDGPYDLILADPPWRYEHCEADNREIENQYPTATVEEICSHKPYSSANSILFLWATAPKLKEALEVMEAWGFNYRSNAVWDKQKIGMGYWWRGQHELLLVGVKGKANSTPESERVSSIFTEKRRGHSQKPECVYEWIERAFPGLRKLEMYCRKPRNGWAVMGNEC